MKNKIFLNISNVFNLWFSIWCVVYIFYSYILFRIDKIILRKNICNYYDVR